MRERERERERGKEMKRDVIDCAWGGRYMKGLFLDGASDTKFSRHPPWPCPLSLPPQICALSF